MKAFSDPAGDSGHAPDVTHVSVSHDPGGRFTISITLANRTDALAPDEQVLVLLDTDRDRATGDPKALGANYLILVDGEDETYAVGRWNGSAYAAVSAPTASVVYSGGPVVSIASSDVGGTRAFNFWIRALKGDGSHGDLDDAPDTGAWRYQARGAFAEQPPSAPATDGLARGRPLHPRAKRDRHVPFANGWGGSLWAHAATSHDGGKR